MHLEVEGGEAVVKVRAARCMSPAAGLHFQVLFLTRRRLTLRLLAPRLKTKMCRSPSPRTGLENLRQPMGAHKSPTPMKIVGPSVHST